jgi:hypothetical protein
MARLRELLSVPAHSPAQWHPATDENGSRQWTTKPRGFENIVVAVIHDIVKTS